MMGLPIPVKMIFPKIQEEFKDIIEKGDLIGLIITVEGEGVRFDFNNGQGIFITPDLTFEQMTAIISEAKEAFDNGK